MRAARRQRLLRDLATEVLVYGVWVKRDGISVFPMASKYTHRLPESPSSPQERQAQARHSVAYVTEESGIELRRALRAARKGNALYAAREAVYLSLDEDALEEARRDALIAMLRAGLDAHPLYAQVAAASSAEEVHAIVIEAETAPHQLALLA